MKQARKKTPQEKKALFYERDRHTNAWHTDKGLRIARRRRKATANQRSRRMADAALSGLLRTGETSNGESGVTNALINSGLIKKPLRKIISVPLREAIVSKQEGRQAREGRKVRRHQADAEKAKAAISFLATMNKKATVAFIDVLALLPRDYTGLFKVKQHSPQLASAAEWICSWNCGSETATRFVRSHPEWAAMLDRCARNINRIAQDNEHGKRRSALVRRSGQSLN